ncbi:MAG TPA: RagB/SusD family nutrient uptake outer membrane protein [Flavitalea sp.]|nr:RagB/SusD family nutrient uptake outer membrane protein [Flavitalea sp.]
MNQKKNLLYIPVRPYVFCMALLILSCFLFSSCMKNVLDKAPTDRFSDESVWRDANLIEQLVNNTYREMPTNNTYASQQIGSVSGETYRGSGASNFINSGNITPSQLGVLNFWTSTASRFNYWKVITNCNLFFNNIEASPIDETLKTRMMGEMYFLRAYAYFRLVAFYGGVPLILKPFDLTDNFDVPRNTYDECMKFVIEELDRAVAALPLTQPATQLGRLTKGAALAAKSRALLYMASPLNNPTNDLAKWQAAADAAKAVIDLNLYGLYPDYKDQFLRANSYNIEAIWSRPFNYAVSPETAYLELDQYPSGYGGYGNDCSPFQNTVDAFEMLSGKLPLEDPDYDPQNPYVNRDPRFYATIWYDGAMFKGREIETFFPGGLDSREGPANAWNATQTGYYLRKFVDESITNPGTANQGNSPWIAFRYAEILLNYAEANYFLGHEDICRQYLNMVRSRPSVMMPDITESGDALLIRLQRERKIELCFEQHQYFDLRRWKTAPIELNMPRRRMDIYKDLVTGHKTYVVNVMTQAPYVFTDKNYLVPIPQTEIDKNPLLVQNPGY